MKTYAHLPLPVFQANIQRQTRSGGGYKFPEGRNKSTYSQETTQKVDDIISSFRTVKNKFAGNINPSLIYEIKVNQGVDLNSFQTILAVLYDLARFPEVQLGGLLELEIG